MAHKTLLLVLLIAHMLGDFYLQSRKIADGKKKQYASLLLHGAVYASPIVLLGVFRMDIRLLWLALGFVLAHWLIDSLKFWILRDKQSPAVYIIDQLVHLASLWGLAALFKGVAVYPQVLHFFGSAGLPFDSFLKGLLLFLIILKPTNITFKYLFTQFKPEDESGGDKKNTGALIGNLERVLIALLLLVGQYTAIGLVITGKSIARYKKIADEKDFAEYYLIGTFYSILAVLVPFLILW